ncbi:Os01g0804566 [Oryza sativa Japonica Group]|uniref:Os01g0804566 protein n=1 Tax=Oryza sativa subsp. japonica TaxID=39947 RepID=A0A0P0V9A6_ORYSJ|nr:Os01g0804566 [Oryza sativa Japonica Group]
MDDAGDGRTPARLTRAPAANGAGRRRRRSYGRKRRSGTERRKFVLRWRILKVARIGGLQAKARHRRWCRHRSKAARDREEVLDLAGGHMTAAGQGCAW